MCRCDLLGRSICLHRGTLLLFSHAALIIRSMRTAQENEKKPDGKPKGQQVLHHQLQFVMVVNQLKVAVEDGAYWIINQRFHATENVDRNNA